jgi:hypothetical protein
MKYCLRAHGDWRTADIVQHRKRVFATREHPVELRYHHLELAVYVNRSSVNARDPTRGHPATLALGAGSGGGVAPRSSWATRAIVWDACSHRPSNRCPTAALPEMAEPAPTTTRRMSTAVDAAAQALDPTDDIYPSDTSRFDEVSAARQRRSNPAAAIALHEK